MRIKDILEEAILVLKQNNIEEPISKARRLLAYSLGVGKEYLIINSLQQLDEDKECIYRQYIEELIGGRPIQYILGIQEFMGIDFHVNENVLIPQPDTEVLVQYVIEIAKQYENPKILDLCTGSGAIAISLKAYIQKADVFASDISAKALETAKKNGRDKNIGFIESNLFDSIDDKFDIIVSNPPYIKTDEIRDLSKEVQNEPHLALDGGKDGLDFYKKIIKQASNYLKENGYLCLEIGEDQKEEVISLLEDTKKYCNIASYKDFGGNDRVIICKLQNLD